MIRRRSVLAAPAVLAALPARAQGATMRLSHQFPPAHHIAKAIAAFAEDVNARNAGIQVQVFPAEQLAKVAENFPGVARGAFEAAGLVNFNWGNTLPEMSGMTIPFLSTDLPKIQRFVGSDAAQFLESLIAKKGVTNLAWLFTTRMSIITSNRKPILTTEDFRGLKVRGLNPLTDHALTAVGAAALATPGPEVPGALQSGVLDAGITDVSAAVSRRYYEFQKFGTVAPYITAYTHLFVNPRWLASLNATQKEALEQAARKAETNAIGLTEETAAAATGELRARGMTIAELDAAGIASWKAQMQKPVVDAFLRSAPEGGARIIELLDKL